MSAEKIKRKLQEAKTIEERRLAVKELLSYVEYLHECYREARGEARAYLYALLVVIPLGLTQYVASTILHATTCAVALLYVRYVLTVLAVVSVSLSVLTVVKVWKARKLEREIL